MLDAKKPIVIYHNNCADGFSAAWAFWQQYGDSYEYYPGVYNAPPPDVFNRDVYFLDFSYRHDVVQILQQYAKSITILDHHQSALEDLWDLKGIDMEHCTINKSGAMIAWEYVKQKEKHRRKVPQLLKHVQDRDLWKFELAHTKEISVALFSYPYTFEVYDKLMALTTNGLKPHIKDGITLQRKYDRDLTQLVKECKYKVAFEGYHVPIANLSYLYASEAGAILSLGHPFAITYYDTEKMRKFSLRSQETGVDVGKIAFKYGGGGHKHAAGFSVPKDHPLSHI